MNERAIDVIHIQIHFHNDNKSSIFLFRLFLRHELLFVCLSVDWFLQVETAGVRRDGEGVTGQGGSQIGNSDDGATVAHTDTAAYVTSRQQGRKEAKKEANERVN